MGPGLAITVLIGAANAAEPSCGQYSALKRLPDKFMEVASGDLGYAELFILSDGVCTCENTPSIDRRRGRVVSTDVNWTCRAATSDEREAVQ